MTTRERTINEYRREESVSMYGVRSTNMVLVPSWKESFLVYNAGVVLPVNRKVPHAHKFTKSTISYWNGQRHSYSPPFLSYSAQEYHEYGPSGGQPTLSTYTQKEIDAIVAESLSKFYDKLRGSIDLSIDLGQRMQTVALARKIAGAVAFVKRHPVTALKRSFDYFERYRRTKSGKLVFKGFDPRAKVRDGSSLWLEYTYGLKPTLQTVYDTIVELARSQEPLMKVMGRAKAVTRRKLVQNGYTFTWAREESNQLLSARYQHVAWYRHSAGTLNLLSRFSSLNPASIAWELMPFSFVVDWFVDVGGYMRNLESSILSASLFKSGYTTFTYAYESTGVWVGSTSDSSGSYQNVSKSGYYKLHGLDRQLMTSSPTPKMPHFQADLSSGRLLNAAALLSQYFRGGKH